MHTNSNHYLDQFYDLIAKSVMISLICRKNTLCDYDFYQFYDLIAKSVMISLICRKNTLCDYDFYSWPGPDIEKVFFYSLHFFYFTLLHFLSVCLSITAA